MAYYSDMIDALESNPIAWANWKYKGLFGIYNYDMATIEMLTPDFELIHVLLKNVKHE